MGQDLSPGNSDKQAIHVGMNPEILRQRDPKSRDLLAPLLGNALDDDVANLQNLDKMLADRFAHLAERRKQLQSRKNEDERGIVVKLLDQEEASCAGCSPHAEEREQEGASYMLRNEELKHLKDE